MNKNVDIHICEYGCGETATHYFSYAKKWCCSTNVAKCSSAIGRMATKRKNNKTYISGAAKGLKTKRNTIDAETGLTILELSGQKTSKTKLNVIDPETGLTIGKSAALKMVKTKLNTIDEETGLNLYELGGLKAVETKKNIIDPVTGWDMNKLAAEKAMKTKTTPDENGITILDQIAEKLKIVMPAIGRKLHEERKNDIDADGLDHYARRSLKMMNNIDENGLNAYERNQNKKTGFGKREQYFDTKIYYQLNYEFRFLEGFRRTLGLDWVRNNIENGPYIKYWHPLKNAYRFYIPDFLVQGKIFEIKSNYTWNRKGTDINLEKINQAKLNSAIEKGYEVFLILENYKIKWEKRI